MSDAIVTPTSDGTLATPPVRTPIASADGNALKQWYYYLRQGATLINAHTNAIGTLARALRYGTHAQRLTTNPEPPGALWIESDRGNVIYEAQADANGNGQWVYSVGTMRGTMSPDQRPSDLGANDAGFRFQATDVTDQLYWNGSAWVDTAPPPPIYLIASGTSNITLTGAAQAVPGAAVTLTRSGKYAVRAGMDLAMSGAGDVNAQCFGQVTANGSIVPGYYMILQSPTSPLRVSIAMELTYSAASTGIVMALVAFKGGGTGSTGIFGSGSWISATWISP